MPFEKLNIIEPIVRALKHEGYTQPTPIQQQAIPVVLNHRDLLGCAQTGTGKTAAFAIPILQHLEAATANQKHIEQHRGHTVPKPIQALILTPTRELAVQIGESFASYGRHCHQKHLVIFGGVSQHSQVETLKRGVDILIATPGRLLDLMNQRFVQLNQIKMFVLDEADRMLDMGFIHDVQKVIAKLPAKRQTLFFSATMPPVIQKLADSILHEPVRVEVTPPSSTVDKIKQQLFYVTKNDKRALLTHILKDSSIERMLVFTRTKHGADRVTRDLVKAGIKSAAIHGNKSQNARQNALTNFKSGEIRVLVATDIAARGIDVDNLSHVLNYELPNVPETYVHRIGRTGRAGLSGVAISFCDAEERGFLKDIQKDIAKQIPVVTDHPYPMSFDTPFVPPAADNRGRKPKSNAHHYGPKSSSKPSGGGSSQGGGGKKSWGKKKSWSGKTSNPQ
jgi:ATP-dependent RNA helicase RhlE